MSAPAALIEAGLEAVVARLGDPAPAVYERLFERMPEACGLFVRDVSGGVRGEMLQRAIEAMLDLVGEASWGAGLLASERVSHEGLGAAPGRFEAPYDAMHEVFREAAGDAWTGDIEAARRSARDAVSRALGRPPPGAA